MRRRGVVHRGGAPGGVGEEAVGGDRELAGGLEGSGRDGGWRAKHERGRAEGHIACGDAEAFGSRRWTRFFVVARKTLVREEVRPRG